ncbi:hypothetical protein GTQ40_06735 [Flavobacteriaceae bacterium R38]|jgi:hypothetical protein|nr:hypothetical protein [Flavobacteriaceae bacterium R38]
MEKINELTTINIGDKIYAPKLDKYFNIVDYAYDDIFKDMLANLAPSSENTEERGFTATLKTLIELGYFKIN